MSDHSILVLGATGILGQAIMREGRARGHRMIGAARHGADHACDMTDPGALAALWEAARPDMAINAAALTDVAACEKDPATAYGLHSHAVATLAMLARERRTLLIQISTDQFYQDEGMRPHREDEPVWPRTVYAASKLAGEILALTTPEALVVRTNLTGFRGWTERPSFVEWCLDVIRHDLPVTLFTDYFTSTIDADSLARTLFELADRNARGLLNVAAREVFSKADFIEALARCCGKPLTNAVYGSVGDLRPPRANSLGLDVGRAETILGHPLPTLDDVVHALSRADAATSVSREETRPWTTTRLSA